MFYSILRYKLLWLLTTCLSLRLSFRMSLSILSNDPQSKVSKFCCSYFLVEINPLKIVWMIHQSQTADSTLGKALKKYKSFPNLVGWPTLQTRLGMRYNIKDAFFDVFDVEFWMPSLNNKGFCGVRSRLAVMTDLTGLSLLNINTRQSRLLGNIHRNNAG